MTLVVSKGITLDNGTSAAAIAGVTPTLDYRFARDKREIETISLTDKLTFSGGNQGTFVGSDGFIRGATTNVPRFDHDPLSGRSLGLLVEEARTNLLLQSNGFNTTWAGNTTETAAAGTAPNGTNTAWEVKDTLDVIPTQHSLAQSVSVTGGIAYSVSVFLKAGTLPRVALILSGPTAFSSGNKAATFNLTTGVLVSVSGTTATAQIIPYPNGWYRCTLTATADGTASATLTIRTDNGTSTSYTGDGTGTIFAWEAQLEAGAFPSSHIPTTTGTLLRPADSAVIDGTGVLTGTRTLVAKPAGCAIESGTDIILQPGFRAERVMVFPTALNPGQIAAVRSAM